MQAEQLQSHFNYLTTNTDFIILYYLSPLHIFKDAKSQSLPKHSSI